MTAIEAIKKLQTDLCELALSAKVDMKAVRDKVLRLRMLGIAVCNVDCGDQDQNGIYKVMNRIKDIEPLLGGLRKSPVRADKEPAELSKEEEAEEEKYQKDLRESAQRARAK